MTRRPSGASGLLYRLGAGEVRQHPPMQRRGCLLRQAVHSRGDLRATMDMEMNIVLIMRGASEGGGRGRLR